MWTLYGVAINAISEGSQSVWHQWTYTSVQMLIERLLEM